MLIKLLLLSGLIYSIYIVPNFLKLDYFNITQINIEDNTKMLDTELTNISEKIYNKNSIYTDYEKIEKFLNEDIRVNDSKIEVAGLGKINIIISGKELKYYVIIKNNIYLVDDYGDIFGYLNENKKEKLPFILAKNKEELKEIVNLVKPFPKTIFYDYISQVYKENENKYIFVLIDGSKLITNTEVDVKKYKVAEVLYFELKNKKKLDYIDLRFDDYIIKYLGDE